MKFNPNKKIKLSLLDIILEVHITGTTLVKDNQSTEWVQSLISNWIILL